MNNYVMMITANAIIYKSDVEGFASSKGVDQRINYEPIAVDKKSFNINIEAPDKTSAVKRMKEIWESLQSHLKTNQYMIRQEIEEQQKNIQQKKNPS